MAAGMAFTILNNRMAKRKSKRKAPTKAKTIEALETQFNCPFCNHERVCEGPGEKCRIYPMPSLHGRFPNQHYGVV
uniref:Transcription elongation factor 1 homolog n=1 Tax=Globodera pallida TaxID=36090 RepID=A0A183BSZ7_GLOPA